MLAIGGVVLARRSGNRDDAGLARVAVAIGCLALLADVTVLVIDALSSA